MEIIVTLAATMQQWTKDRFSDGFDRVPRLDPLKGIDVSDDIIISERLPLITSSRQGKASSLVQLQPLLTTIH